MWFRKKAPVAPYLECVGCGCLMRAARKEIAVERASGSLYDTGSTITYWIEGDSPEPVPSFESYCGRCAPSYDVKIWIGPTPHYYRREPSRDVEVTEKGKTIKEDE